LPQNDAQLSLAILGLMLGGDPEPARPVEDEPTRVIAEHTRKQLAGERGRLPVERGADANVERRDLNVVPTAVQTRRKRPQDLHELRFRD
jgi:microcystin degradation protein MlrC